MSFFLHCGCYIRFFNKKDELLIDFYITIKVFSYFLKFLDDYDDLDDFFHGLSPIIEEQSENTLTAFCREEPLQGKQFVSLQENTKILSQVAEFQKLLIIIHS